VTRTLDALNGSERRNTHLNGVALGSGAELFEQISNGGSELSLVTGTNRRHGRLSGIRLDFSAHETSMAVVPRSRK
jgi:hypothetical protein